MNLYVVYVREFLGLSEGFSFVLGLGLFVFVVVYGFIFWLAGIGFGF